MRCQQFRQFRRDADFRELVFFDESTDEQIYEFRDILFSFSQRGQRNGNDVEPIVEVLPESFLFNRGFKSSVGGGDNSDIHRVGLGPPHRFDLSFLEDPQQFHLNFNRQFADFIEEDRPAVCLLEFPFPCGMGIGIRAFDVSKERTFDKT